MNRFAGAILPLLLVPVIYCTALPLLVSPSIGSWIELPRSFVALAVGVVGFVGRSAWVRGGAGIAVLGFVTVGPDILVILTPGFALRFTSLLVRTGHVGPVLLATTLAAVPSLIPLARMVRTFRRERQARARDAHGSARWADRSDLAEAKLLEEEGVVLGQVRGRGGWTPVIDGSDHHILLIMPPGAGKTTGPGDPLRGPAHGPRWKMGGVERDEGAAGPRSVLIRRASLGVELRTHHRDVRRSTNLPGLETTSTSSLGTPTAPVSFKASTSCARSSSRFARLFRTSSDRR